LRRLSGFDLDALLYASCWRPCVSGTLHHRCLVLSIHWTPLQTGRVWHD
jgi:hypothetical protein